MLTDRQLAGLKSPASGRIEVADGTGLIVRVTASGTKTFGVWWRIPRKFGGAEQKGFYTIGPTSAVTLADARRRAREILDLARPVHTADTVLGHVLKGSGRSYIHGARLIEAVGALWKWNAHLERVLGVPGCAEEEKVAFAS